MGVKLQRKKGRHFLLSVLYRIHQLIPASSERKLRWYLDLEWIFERLALETSFKYYRSQEHPIRRSAAEFVLQRLTPEDRVLDLGCKYGEMSHDLAGKAAFVVGIDHDARAIEVAKRRLAPNMEFHCMDAVEYLKNAGRKYDVLILSHILEHLDDPKEFLERFKTYFDRIYIELPDFDRSFMNQYRKDLGMELIYTDIDHVSEFDRHELTRLLEDAGIKILDTEYRFGMQRYWCAISKGT